MAYDDGKKRPNMNGILIIRNVNKALSQCITTYAPYQKKKKKKKNRGIKMSVDGNDNYCYLRYVLSYVHSVCMLLTKLSFEWLPGMHHKSNLDLSVWTGSDS